MRCETAPLGARISRYDLNVLHTAEGAECTIDGLALIGERQLADTHTSIDHAKPRCTSRELYKGILGGSARGVFHGTILVRKDAQKTDAVQTNKNLLLSRHALVNSTPALEIHDSLVQGLPFIKQGRIRGIGVTPIGERRCRPPPSIRPVWVGTIIVLSNSQLFSPIGRARG